MRKIYFVLFTFFYRFTPFAKSTSGTQVFEQQGFQNGNNYINAGLAQGLYVIAVVGRDFKLNKKIIIR